MCSTHRSILERQNVLVRRIYGDHILDGVVPLDEFHGVLLLLAISKTYYEKKEEIRNCERKQSNMKQIIDIICL